MQNDSNFRAKQFLPFDALTGFYDAIRKVEKINEEKKEFSIEQLDDLDQKIKLVKKNDLIKVKYFYQDEYIETIDKLKKIDKVYHKLVLCNLSISFDDIMDIEIIRRGE